MTARYVHWFAATGDAAGVRAGAAPPATSANGTPLSRPISSAFAPSRRLYSSVFGASADGFTHALNVKLPPAGTFSDALAGSGSDPLPSNRAPLPTMPSSIVLNDAFCAWLPYAVRSFGGAPPRR